MKTFFHTFFLSLICALNTPFLQAKSALKFPHPTDTILEKQADALVNAFKIQKAINDKNDKEGKSYLNNYVISVDPKLIYIPPDEYKELKTDFKNGGKGLWDEAGLKTIDDFLVETNDERSKKHYLIIASVYDYYHGVSPEGDKEYSLFKKDVTKEEKIEAWKSGDLAGVLSDDIAQKKKENPNLLLKHNITTQDLLDFHQSLRTKLISTKELEKAVNISVIASLYYWTINEETGEAEPAIYDYINNTDMSKANPNHIREGYERFLKNVESEPSRAEKALKLMQLYVQFFDILDDPQFAEKPNYEEFSIKTEQGKTMVAILLGWAGSEGIKLSYEDEISINKIGKLVDELIRIRQYKYTLVSGYDRQNLPWELYFGYLKEHPLISLDTDLKKMNVGKLPISEIPWIENIHNETETIHILNALSVEYNDLGGYADFPDIGTYTEIFDNFLDKLENDNNITKADISGLRLGHWKAFTAEERIKLIKNTLQTKEEDYFVAVVQATTATMHPYQRQELFDRIGEVPAIITEDLSDNTIQAASESFLGSYNGYHLYFTPAATPILLPEKALPYFGSDYENIHSSALIGFQLYGLRYVASYSNRNYFDGYILEQDNIILDRHKDYGVYDYDDEEIFAKVLGLKIKSRKKYYYIDLNDYYNNQNQVAYAYIGLRVPGWVTETVKVSQKVSTQSNPKPTTIPYIPPTFTFDRYYLKPDYNAEGQIATKEKFEKKLKECEGSKEKARQIYDATVELVEKNDEELEVPIYFFGSQRTDGNQTIIYSDPLVATQKADKDAPYAKDPYVYMVEMEEIEDEKIINKVSKEGYWEYTLNISPEELLSQDDGDDYYLYVKSEITLYRSIYVLKNNVGINYQKIPMPVLTAEQLLVYVNKMYLLGARTLDMAEDRIKDHVNEVAYVFKEGEKLFSQEGTNYDTGEIPADPNFVGGIWTHNHPIKHFELAYADPNFPGCSFSYSDVGIALRGEFREIRAVLPENYGIFSLKKETPGEIFDVMNVIIDDFDEEISIDIELFNEFENEYLRLKKTSTFQNLITLYGLQGVEVNGAVIQHQALQNAIKEIIKKYGYQDYLYKKY